MAEKQRFGRNGSVADSQSQNKGEKIGDNIPQNEQNRGFEIGYFHKYDNTIIWQMIQYLLPL